MAMGTISAGASFGRISESAAVASGGRVLDAGRGEHLVHFRDGGDIFIFSGVDTGSDSLALGTQQIKARGGIPIHRHLHMEEAFYVIEGMASVFWMKCRIPFPKAPRYSYREILGMDLKPEAMIC